VRISCVIISRCSPFPRVIPSSSSCGVSTAFSESCSGTPQVLRRGLGLDGRCCTRSSAS
jgi:hypothetical protein